MVVGSLTGLAPGRAMAIIHCKEIALVPEILEDAAGVLTFLLLRPGTHHRIYVHLDVFDHVDLIVLFLLIFTPPLLLFIGLPEAQHLQKTHGSVM